jgi:hypothetical protein
MKVLVLFSYSVANIKTRYRMNTWWHLVIHSSRLLSVYKFQSIPGQLTSIHINVLQTLAMLCQVRPTHNYTRSIQQSIWKREEASSCLISCIPNRHMLRTRQENKSKLLRITLHHYMQSIRKRIFLCGRTYFELAKSFANHRTHSQQPKRCLRSLFSIPTFNSTLTRGWEHYHQLTIIHVQDTISTSETPMELIHYVGNETNSRLEYGVIGLIKA